MQRNKGKRQGTIESRVARGAKFLDRVKPDWFTLIDLYSLNLASGCHCVLGQIVDAEQSKVGQYHGSYGAVVMGSIEGPGTVDHELLQIRRDELSRIDNLKALVMPQRTAKRYGFHLTCAQMGNGTDYTEWELLTDEWKRVIQERLDAAVTA